MKEMLKSKTIIAFVVVVLGLTLISIPGTELESSSHTFQNISYNTK